MLLFSDSNSYLRCIILFLGGPIIAEEIGALNGEVRFVLIGTVHGAFAACSNKLPGIFVETDDLSVLEFLHQEVYGSGL